MSLREEIRWIAVTDEFPEIAKTVLLSLSGNIDSRSVWFGFTNGKEWFADNGRVIGGRVTHWAELPLGVHA